jgi:hypothetical protein
MSTPRRPVGRDRPGRLAATRLKVLAAELTDPGRLARGKLLWSDDAVLDLEVSGGLIDARVQGSRPQPYTVLLHHGGPHADVPSRQRFAWECSCPDHDLRQACKHVVAALFAAAQEISIDLDVLQRWAALDDDDRVPDRLPDNVIEITSRLTRADAHDQPALSPITPTPVPTPSPPPPPPPDPWGHLLVSAGPLPEIGHLALGPLPPIDDELVRGVLDSVFEELS